VPPTGAGKGLVDRGGGRVRKKINGGARWTGIENYTGTRTNKHQRSRSDVKKLEFDRDWKKSPLAGEKGEELEKKKGSRFFESC